jgi:error-prone DNA polymerase
MTYAEIGTTTNFSFLRGASHPQEYVHQAVEHGLSAIGIADRNTLAGVVRAYSELSNETLAYKPKLLVGARLVFVDGTPDILVYPRDRAAYGRLCRLLSRGKLKAEKGECILTLADFLEFSEGQFLVLVPAWRFTPGSIAGTLNSLRTSRAAGVFLAASFFHRGDDERRLARLKRVADTVRVPLIATNDVLYHDPERRPLQDVLTCVCEKTSIDKAGRKLQANAERHLKSPQEMQKLFAGYEDALAETVRFADRIVFSLDDLKYQYPDEPVPPGRTAQEHLEYLTWAGTYRYFPDGIDANTRNNLFKELALIAKLNYAHYFLTVHDIVHYARSQNILCQGRGSAANSAVCFMLGVTSVNPQEINLLFERFLSEERVEPPDIDVDFEHNRREEVMQYVYRRYGRQRAAIIATVIHYRPRSAIRDVGKALGLTEDITAALADTVWGSWGDGYTRQQLQQAGLDPNNPMIGRAIMLATELIGFPRHLSQHVGGYVLTQDQLDTYVPIGNAAMDHRTFIEWDKDDVDALRMMKVDVLALGMLTCIRKGFDLIHQHKGERWELADIKGEENDEVYQMLQRGESLGVFQVESRAQMNMLPRLRPKNFYDLVIEVAIVRPGPIQGDMVHPYLKRRNGELPVVFPAPDPRFGDKNELRDILGKTLGVPLFQEQAMRIAIEAAKFTPDEANQLRKAMATFRHTGTIHKFEDKMVQKLIERGYPEDFARNCFNQIKGFGEYGFPESHAASFAKLVYVSSWLKHHHPDVFCCALLNSQPMGFYAPAQIVADARKNGVVVREIDVSFSFADNTLEERCGKYHAMRIGFRQIDGFAYLDPDDYIEPENKEEETRKRQANDWSKRIVEARQRRLVQLKSPRMLPAPSPQRGEGWGEGHAESARDITLAPTHLSNLVPFSSLEDFARATALPKRALILLADADAFRSLGLDRRAALWAVRRLPDDVPLPLFTAALAREQPDERAAPLPAMPLPEHVVADYQTIRLSIKGHPMEFLRPMFAAEGIKSCTDATALPDGRYTRCAGVVLVRQRPGTAKGTVFMTIEDETGIANIVVWPKKMSQYRKEVMGARLILIEGRVQKSVEGVTHIVAERLIDRTFEMGRLSDGSLAPTKTLPAPPALIELVEGDEVHPRYDRARVPRARHPRNVRILPPSRDFH